MLYAIDHHEYVVVDDIVLIDLIEYYYLFVANITMYQMVLLLNNVNVFVFQWNYELMLIELELLVELEYIIINKVINIYIYILIESPLIRG